MPTFTYHATYSMERLHGVPNNWVECEGIRFESNIGLPYIQMICRALKDAGHPDGSIAFYEDGYSDVAYSFPSIYEIVARMDAPAAPRKPPAPPRESSASSTAPSIISETIFLALTQLSTSPRDWCGLHGHTRGVLLDRGYVTVEGEVPEITAIGRQAIKSYQETKISYPSNLSAASKDELIGAAVAIGLKANGNLLRTLSFIETTVSQRSLEDIEAMAWRVKVPVRMGRGKSEMMKKRRILAAIVNAGKLAQAL